MNLSAICLATSLGLPLLGTARAADLPGVLFDTDMGNDIDDVFALGMLHALQDRGECRVLAVTVCQRHDLAGPFCDVINTFYGHPEISVGVTRSERAGGIAGPYLAKVIGDAGRFPHALRSSKDAPEAVDLMRRVLSRQPDGSVVVIAVGLSTNLAGLLASPADRHSPLAGRDLVARKVRGLTMMAGDFGRPKAEFNVESDPKSAREVFEGWPTEIVVSPFEVGSAIPYPEPRFDRTPLAEASHPLMAADVATFGKPNGFMTWDLTAVLHAVRPDRGYFRLSEAGTIRLSGDDVTTLVAAPGGKHRYLQIRPGDIDRVRDAMVDLASQPPSRR